MLFSRGGDKPALIRAKVYGFKILCAGLHRYGKSNFAALARCARVPRAAARRGSLILARGQLRPPLHPPDQGLPPVDPTKGASPSGLPTGRVALPWPLPAVSTAASTRRAFVPSMDLQTVGDFALPLDPHRPAVRRLDPVSYTH